MIGFLNLPEIVLEKIFLNLGYDEIARHRIVCREFDRIGKQLLNKGFISVEKYHTRCLRAVKSQLPRRESERRNHPLARHCDILTAIETRLSMLVMTFMKYIDVNLCCFIPGKVIDEIFRVLRYIQTTKTPPRAHEILQELRDISSMAMEHFDEKIVPKLKQHLNTTSVAIRNGFSVASATLLSSASPRIIAQEKIRQEFLKIQTSANYSKTSVRALKKEVVRLNMMVKKQQATIARHNGKIREQTNTLRDHESQIGELRRHLEEYDQKFADLAAELSRSRTDPSDSPPIESIPLRPTNSQVDEATVSRSMAATEPDTGSSKGNQLKRKLVTESRGKKRTKI